MCTEDVYHCAYPGGGYSAHCVEFCSLGAADSGSNRSIARPFDMPLPFGTLLRDLTRSFGGSGGVVSGGRVAPTGRAAATESSWYREGSTGVLGWKVRGATSAKTLKGD
ncbi:hypothetical protein KM043_004264 [Ampulex compressa]|nr:hypothetical protein KM043_004264 [Ampulex compressa]